MDLRKISTQIFFMKKEDNSTFIFYIKNSFELKKIYKKSKNLKEFFEEILKEQYQNCQWYWFVSKHFPNHFERLKKLFNENGCLTTIADMASIYLFNTKADIYIKNHSKCDGTVYVSVFENSKINFADFMKPVDIILNGYYIISNLDTKISGSSQSLNGKYAVYTCEIEDCDFVAFKRIWE